MSTVVASSENDAASATTQSPRPRGSDPAGGFCSAVCGPGACGFPPTTPAALGAGSAANYPAVDTVARRGDALRRAPTSPATARGAAGNRLSAPHTESPNSDI